MAACKKSHLLVHIIKFSLAFTNDFASQFAYVIRKSGLSVNLRVRNAYLENKF